MTLILSGTDGVSDIDGTAATPAIRGTDANTGIFFPAADTIAFAEGGAEAMRIDSSGNVGIGTSSPTANYKLDIAESNTGIAASAKIRHTAAGNQATIQFQNTTTGSAATDGLLVGTSATDCFIYNYENTPLYFATNNTERMRIDSSGNVGIGTTSPTTRLHVSSGNSYANLRVGNAAFAGRDNNNDVYFYSNSTTAEKYLVDGEASLIVQDNGIISFYNAPSGTAGNTVTFTERARISSDGTFMVAKTTVDSTTQGLYANPAGSGFFHLVVTNTTSTTNQSTLYLNRQTSDGRLIEFRQADTSEGDISVSGTTVSYNGGHLSRYAQTTTAKDDSLLKGTVLANLDEMNVYVAPTTYWTEKDELPEGVNVGDVKVETHTVNNEQLNKVKVSDVEGDVNVAGVFVNWSHDEAHNVDEINMAMTGDMIIRIAQGVVVQKGDLLMSAGDGTAKPQGDDIVRSKTVAKVTSNHVTCTYADGSYCVPCVLMAC